MRKTAIIAGFMAAFWAGAALGQDQTTEPTAEAESGAGAGAEAAAESGAAQAEAGAEELPTALAGAQAGDEAPAEEVIAAVHTDWQIRCRVGGGGCYMYQLAKDSRDVPVAEMSIVAINPAQNDVVAGITMMTPLKTYLPVGVQLQIDNGRPQRYQFDFCAVQGCIARLGLGQNGLDQFRRGNKARLTVASADSREVPIVLDVSLAGFTAAFADLSSR